MRRRPPNYRNEWIALWAVVVAFVAGVPLSQRDGEGW